VALKLAKYFAVGKITVRNNLAYVFDVLIRSIFLLVILYVFLQLWTVTFAGVGADQIGGYTLQDILWYLIFAEAIVMGVPRLSTKIEDEVKKGDIGYQLTRPMNYLLLHYFQYMGEALVRIPLNLAVGSVLGFFTVGWPDYGWGWLGFVGIGLLSITLNFLLMMCLSLCAFWVEEVRGLEFVLNKLIFTVGGMMLPLELFPELVRQVAEWLPFQAVTYFASRTAVHFELAAFGQMVLIQLGWIALFAWLATAIYQKGVRKLHVNGG